MARIRSVKPEFWTSEQIAECSPNTRLMFIGMWNFCDDYGVHPASCARLKMEVFPADAISSADVRRMIDELLANELLTEYEIDGSLYWLVTGFDKHQKPDTKTGKYPLPNGEIGGKIRRKTAEHSPNEQRTIAERSPPELEVDLEVELEKPFVADKPQRKKSSSFPAGFVADETSVALAAKLGLSLPDELEAFEDHHRAKGTTMLDWNRALKTWLRNASKFSSVKQKQSAAVGSIGGLPRRLMLADEVTQ